MKKKIIVTIPAYNEEKTIGRVIDNVNKVMVRSGHDFKVIVVNDGSTDRTENIAKKKGAKVHSFPRNYGLAEAFRTEMEKSLQLAPDIIVHTDADGQYRADEIPKLIAKVEEGYDLVLGSRFKGRIERMPWLKRWGNRQFSKVISKIIRRRITDGQTGFRAFTPEVASLTLTSDHTYTQEQILRAAKSRFRIAEVPVYFAERQGKTKSRLIKNPFEYAFRAWINILRTYRDYEPLKFFGSVGLIFIMIGMLMSFYIFLVYLTLGIAVVKNKIPTLILIMICFTTGFQILLFGFLADQKRAI